MSAEGLRACEEKMRREGLPAVAIETFAHYYRQLEAGETGMIPEASIEPIASLPDADALPPVEGDAAELLDRAVIVRLNGGLGTSMGMTRAKSLLPVKDGQSFLDVIARQVLTIRRRAGARLPLVLMDSFHTREDSLAALRRHPGLETDVPLDFVQHKVPKVGCEDLEPVSWPADPELEWAPPGHGDLYTALATSGMLQTLLEGGYRYAFVANADNLGATLDPRLLAHLVREEIPFLMEVADRTESDRKGGHLARLRDGRLVLRESAQTPEGDMDAFQDVDRHRYFNTNTLWIDLRALDEVLRDRGGVLGLPMIRNRKTVDPTDEGSPCVYQLETAMGAAISAFDGAQAIRVPRTRFAPVKTTNDLLVLRSDVYELTPDAHVVLARGRETAPYVDLDPEHYRLLADFDARFPEGPPSLIGCERLVVRGDVTFGAGVVVRGDVEIDAGDAPRRLQDGALLSGGE